MRNRPIAILLLVLFTAQMVVVGLYGGRVICFGSDQAHDPATGISVCESGCDHDSSQPIVVVHEAGHDSSCTDVNIADTDLLSTLRDSDLISDCMSVYATVCVLSLVCDTQTVSIYGPPKSNGADSGGAAGLGLVRATRLIL